MLTWCTSCKTLGECQNHTLIFYVLFQDNLFNSDDLKYVILKKSNEYCPGSTSLWMAYADSEKNCKHSRVIKSVICLYLLVL